MCSTSILIAYGRLLSSLPFLSLSLSANALPPNCDESTIHCIGPGLEYDSSAEHPETAFQAAINAANPGDTLAIKGGIYQHQADSPNKTFMHINVSGRSDAPITIQSFNGENAHIQGFGFPEGTAGPSVSDERLIHVSGDHIHIKNLELSDSTRWGVLLTGSHGLVENVTVHDNWESNIMVYGVTKEIENNTIRNVETYRSRHGSGIWIVPSAATPKIVRGTVIENSIAYQNGYQPNGEKVPGVAGETVGGGNSDGISAFKNCAEDAARFNVPNLCPDTLLKGNVVWHNADDGIDISFGDGSRLIDNISFENGPMGNKGFKVYAKVKGGISFIGNVAMGNLSNGFEFQIEETGFAYNNTSIRNDLHGFRASITSGGRLTSTNNLGAYNTGSLDIDEREGIVNTTNWAANQEGDPLISITDFSNTSVNTDVLSNGSIEQKAEAIKNQFQAALTPQENSPLIDAGTLLPNIHCPRADDNTIEPMSPNDLSCRHWLGDAPDIGAYEYTGASINRPMPPVLLVE